MKELILMKVESLLTLLTPKQVREQRKKKHEQEVQLSRLCVTAYRNINLSSTAEHLRNCKRFIADFIEPNDKDGQVTKRLKQEVITRSKEIKVFI